MATSRDDFIIAIRSAFLKKSYQQKFSLLTLIFLSIIIIILGNLNFKPIQYVKIGINEIVYRSSFIISIPENYLKNLGVKLDEHLSIYDQFKKNEAELKILKEKKLNNDFLILENNKLRDLINESIQSEDLYAKVLVDKDSPYLKSIILNKGSKDNVKIGMAIVDNSYLVGKVIEVNYTNSRALLLSDLNSKIPSVLEPDDIQAVVSGTGNDFGTIEHTQKDFKEDFKNKKIIAYTSGLGGLFKPGIPIGKIDNISEGKINFYSDFTQLNYVKIVSYKVGEEK
jgi:rod shape-determining protein MreC